MAKNAAVAQIDSILKKSKGNKKEKGGGAQKYGRQLSSPAMARYRAEGRRETNRQRNVRRHLRRLPADVQARAWYAEHGGPAAQAFLAALPAAAA